MSNTAAAATNSTEPPAIKSVAASAARAIANARRAGELSVAVKSPLDYQMFVDRVAPLIAAAYAPVMECLREAITKSGHVAGCSLTSSYAWDPKNCNCWVSRAQKLLEEK